jgi:hypothetical protein
MGEPITIKRKKLKIKSNAVKSATPVVAGGAAVAPAAEAVKQPSYTFYAIIGLFAMLMFIGIIALQWTEWTFLQPAFPHPIQTGAVATPAPAVTN